MGGAGTGVAARLNAPRCTEALLTALYTLAQLHLISLVQPRPGSGPAVICGGIESSKAYEKVRPSRQGRVEDSDAESEVFTAKAQQLIARHRINGDPRRLHRHGPGGRGGACAHREAL
jgi:hypothetical protein